MSSRGFSREEIKRLYALAGLPAPKEPAKYQRFGGGWTYCNEGILHTTARDCGPLPVDRCPICGDSKVKADRPHWYQSRSEARFAWTLDMWLRAERILRWRRGVPIVLSAAAKRVDRITYRPDFEVWDDPNGSWRTPFDQNPRPDRRYEVKGARRMISQQGWLRIKLYRAAVARGEQPPLHLVDGNGNDLTP